MGNSELAQGWGIIWETIPGPIKTLLIVAGVAIMVWALIKYFKDRSGNGAGGNTKGLLWSVLFGFLLVLPNTIIKLLLNVVSAVFNFVANFLGRIF